ncbi:hypothetical protein NDU88_003911 [Pleurodeles waltl]|uniref:Uncharacterized protein n=1 Tax=Pleurodeles waltl TaxID=8319 RepID=A0AAV7TPS0_PLEWA|nr:hypothetical protein NDU88_003911 [Pleurodeles waltl]
MQPLHNGGKMQLCYAQKTVSDHLHYNVPYRRQPQSLKTRQGKPSNRHPSSSCHEGGTATQDKPEHNMSSAIPTSLVASTEVTESPRVTQKGGQQQDRGRKEWVVDEGHKGNVEISKVTEAGSQIRKEDLRDLLDETAAGSPEQHHTSITSRSTTQDTELTNRRDPRIALGRPEGTNFCELASCGDEQNHPRREPTDGQSRINLSRRVSQIADTSRHVSKSFFNTRQ